MSVLNRCYFGCAWLRQAYMYRWLFPDLSLEEALHHAFGDVLINAAQIEAERV